MKIEPTYRNSPYTVAVSAAILYDRATKLRATQNPQSNAPSDASKRLMADGLERAANRAVYQHFPGSQVVDVAKAAQIYEYVKTWA